MKSKTKSIAVLLLYVWLSLAVVFTAFPTKVVHIDAPTTAVNWNSSPTSWGGKK